jgi:hypothetical protein
MWCALRRAGGVGLVSALAAMAFLVGPGAAPAHACSCAAATDAEAFERSDAVFVGEVIDYEPPPAGDVVSSTDPATWTFGVSEVFKGEVTAVQQVVSAWSGASCGLEIDRHGEFLVFATREGFGVEVGEGQYHAGLCGGTRSTSDGSLTVDVVSSPPGRATAPVQAAGAVPPGDDAGGSWSPVVLGAAAAVAVGLAGAGISLLRRRPG